jgi:hypothetical protein
MAGSKDPNNYAALDVVYTDGKWWSLITKNRVLFDTLKNDGWGWYSSLIYHQSLVLYTNSQEKAEKVAREHHLEIQDLAGVYLT